MSLRRWMDLFEEQPEVIVIDRERTSSQDRDKPELPKRYMVVLHNDDYSPAEFVAHLLMKHFRLSGDAAWNVMVDVHKKGKGVIDTFPKDIAETKAKIATDDARASGHPTLFTAEEE